MYFEWISHQKEFYIPALEYSIFNQHCSLSKTLPLVSVLSNYTVTGLSEAIFLL